MALTERTLGALSAEHFDLVIIGGGVHGVMLALEASRAGLHPLVVERSDFGGATSSNSLRILHGGFRYLQTLNLPRFRESVRERRWFLRNFPNLLRPLPCLMPLYGDGVRRRSIMRLALTLNDRLSSRRNLGVSPELNLPDGRIASAEQTREIFRGVDARGLEGGAIWYDAFVPNTSRLLVDALREACSGGAAALNYVEAEGLLEAHGRVEGIRARDSLSGRELEFRSDVVINAAGPWSREFTAACGSEQHELFQPSIAWNIVFNRESLADHALAVKPRRPNARTYFLVPWNGALLAGTGHAAWAGDLKTPRPSESLLEQFISDLNAAVPGLELNLGDVARVFSGLLPAARPGSSNLATREVIVDHSSLEGPAGFFSLSGVKFTTARAVAAKVLRRAFPSATGSADTPFECSTYPSEHRDYPFFWMPPTDDQSWQSELKSALVTEAVHHLDDLLLRRSSLGDNPKRALALAPEVCRLFSWDADRTRREIDALTCKVQNVPRPI